MCETAELENDRVSLRHDDLAVDKAASFLRTRPPVGEEGEEVGEHGYQFEIIEVLAEVR